MNKIEKENRIHYFVKDESNEAFVNIRLESYMEIPQNNGKVKFKIIESLRLFFSSNIQNYECASFHIDFGRNDCFYSGCKSIKELKVLLQSDYDIYRFKFSTEKKYLKMREKAIKIFLEHPHADYSKLQIGCDFPI